MFAGIGIGGYRSFPSEVQLVGPLERVNIVIGPNNSGKSNVLRAFHQHAADFHQSLTSLGNRSTEKIDPAVDPHQSGDAPPALTVAWPIDLDSGELASRADLAEVLQTEPFTRGTSSSWIEFSTPGPPPGPLTVSAAWVNSLTLMPRQPDWRALSNALTNTTGGGAGADMRRVVEWVIRSCMVTPPPISVVPAHRQIRTGQRSNGEPQWDLAGVGLVDRLDDLKNAGHTKVADKRLHWEIREAMAELLEVESVEYNVSRQRAHELELIIDGQHLPLSSFGTGYEHALMILVAVMTYEDHLFCIEEPEIHLHPRLQRQLGALLRKRGGAQLLISTHSAHMIDALGAKVFRTAYSEGATGLSQPLAQDQIALLDELGYRASDVLQTNYIIWVEGPSDRIYLNAWIRAHPEGERLVEGVHYTLMFYGGALLDRLSAAAEGDEDDSLVPLTRIQQHFAIVADSDKRSTADALKRRVDRVGQELDRHETAMLWVTAGREIESYVTHQRLEEAVKEVHPSVKHLLKPSDEFKSPLRARKRDGTNLATVDKVAVAECVVKAGVDLDVLDLRERVADLVAHIQTANR